MKKHNTFLIFLLLMFTLNVTAQVREIPSPAGAQSAQPNLTVSSEGRVYLSWIERLPDKSFSLRFSIREKDGWSSPRVIAEGTDWFVNWADFPSMIALRDGSLAAHWLQKSGSDTYAYDVRITRSFDGGKTWAQPFTPHRDGVKAEHGFVSLLAARDGNLAAVWLDGREMKAGAGDDHGHGSMTLRYVKIRRDGTLTDESVLDARVCECCQTSAAVTDNGAVVVYRDRSDTEMRDISIIRQLSGTWTAPQHVFADQWKINGCPVNGPAIAARARQVAVAWFTGAENASRVKVAFSNNAGVQFQPPVIVDDGNPMGRVDIQLLDDGSALVCWLEKLTNGGEIRLRRVFPDGRRENSVTVAANGTARSNGFPQMVRSGKMLIFAWTGARVLTAEMKLP